jgi:hypothetical protein
MTKGVLPPGLKNYLENRDKSKKIEHPKKLGETKILGYSVPVYDRHSKKKPYFTQEEGGEVFYHFFSTKTGGYVEKVVIPSSGLPNKAMTENRLKLLLKKGIIKK